MARLWTEADAAAAPVAVARAGLYRGWLMAGLGFLCLLFVFGAPTGIMPLIYGPVMHEFGWSRSEATLGFTYKNIASTIMALFLIGPFVERFGIKPLFILSCLAVGGGMAAFLWVDGLGGYYAASFCIGIGTATVMIAAKMIVSRWFIRNQGMAIGIAMAGTSAGGAIFPILGAALIESYGWRIAVAASSLGIWLVALPLYLLIAKEDPSDGDIAPDAPRMEANGVAAAETLRSAELGLGFADILKTPTFWLAGFSIVLVSAADAGVFQNTALFLEGDIGVSKSLAAMSLSGVFALGIVAKLIAGWVFDRHSIAGVRFWYVLLAISVLLAFPVQGLLTILLFTATRGIGHGGLVTEGAVVAKHCFGAAHLTKVLPIFIGAHALGSAIGPVALSYVRDTTGAYDLGFGAAALCCIFAAVMLHWAKPFYRDRLRAAQTPR